MIHVHRIGRVLAAVLFLVLAREAGADGLRLGASAGVGRAYGQTYFELGGRLGYDIGFGFTPEVGLAFWGAALPTSSSSLPASPGTRPCPSSGLTWVVSTPTTS